MLVFGFHFIVEHQNSRVQMEIQLYRIIVGVGKIHPTDCYPSWGVSSLIIHSANFVALMISGLLFYEREVSLLQ